MRVILRSLALFLIPASLSAGIVGPRVSATVESSGVAHVIVALREVPAHSRVAALSRLERDVRIAERWDRLGAFSADVNADALATLQNDPDVLRVDLDSGGSGGDDSSFGLIGGNTVASLGYAGTGVRVAVLDSGVDLNHVDLKGAIADEQCFCTNSDGSGCCPDRQTTQSGPGAAADEYGHGTNVTGIIASKGTIAPAGLAPGVRVIAVRVLDSRNRFSGTSQILSGMDWVAAKHPEVRVVNMSLYTDALFATHCDAATAWTIAFARAIAALRANGALVFVCSGNSASATSMGAPACNAQAISVGAVYGQSFGTIVSTWCTDATTTADQVACFSNSNATLDLLGPGVRVESTGLNAATSTYTGTSQATPHAAAVAALLLGIAPDLTADQVEAILVNSGKPLIDGRNGVVTPRVDALAAVQAVVNHRPRRRVAH